MKCSDLEIWEIPSTPKNTSGTEVQQFAAIVQAETVASVQKTMHSEQESMEFSRSVRLSDCRSVDCVAGGHALAAGEEPAADGWQMN